MNIPDMLGRIRPRRKVRGMAAALLPYEADGGVAVNALQQHIATTHRAGLINAVNMDTGYANCITDEEKTQVLKWTREVLGDRVPFVAGAYIEGRDGDVVTLYRKYMDEIVAFGGTPILFQTAKLHPKSAQEKISAYKQVCKGYPDVLAFELGKMFAPNGEIWDADTFKGVMDIPEISGMKHSSLDRVQELQRIALRDERRADFRIYTGNDHGINMIEYGSDYLLGLATFAPEAFALRDKLWENGDARYYALSDALQLVGNVAFRTPVPAYKHSAAHFLHLAGRIPSALTHPKSPKRPAWEGELMRDLLERLRLATPEL